MSYLITSTNTGVVLSNSTTQNPATVTSFAYVTNTTTNHSGDAIHGTNAAAWNVTNYGTVKSNPTAGSGIDLQNGGDITNFTTATIGGYATGVFIIGTTGTVSNSGTIDSTGTGSTGVNLQNGGYVTNALTGTIGAGPGGDGVVIANAPGTVNNAGTVTGPNLGVWLEGGGTVSNSGSIAATDATGDGVTFGNAAVGSGTLSNFGTITAGNLGVWLEAGGQVTNNSFRLISGGFDGVEVSGSVGTVNNRGTIESTGTSGSGVELQAGGYVVNGGIDAASALISGYDGVRISGPSGTLTNFSTIASTGTGFGAQGVDFLAGGTLSNYGTILGVGTHASGINAGFANDTIVNGSARYSGATIAGWLNGIDQFSSLGIVVNFGTVESSNGDAVYLQAGGTVSNNGTAGLLSGLSDGVKVNGGPGTVVNTGTIVGTNANGVYLEAGGQVTNTSTGLIIGGSDGVKVTGGAGMITNLGTIADPASWSGDTVDLEYIFPTKGVVLRDFGAQTIAARWSFYAEYASVTAYAITVGSTGGVSWQSASYNGFDLIDDTKNPNITGVTLVKDTTGKVSQSDAYYTSNTVGFNFQGQTWAAGSYAIFDVTFGKSSGVALSTGGTVTNGASDSTAALIKGSAYGILVTGAGGTVANFGTVEATGANGIAIDLGSGGSVANAAGGLIEGATAVALIAGGTVDNSGVISATGATGTGVELLSGGFVSNSSTGIIQGPAYGIEVTGAVGTIVNDGLVHATTAAKSIGILLGGGGTVENSGTITSDGLGNFSGAIVMLATGRVVNAAGALIAGNFDGIEGNSNADLVTNLGTITAHERGVVLFAGGTVVNGASNVMNSLITAPGATNAVDTGYGSALVVNYGTLAGRFGVFGRNQVTTTNYGLISATRGGVYLAGSGGTVTNPGSIVASNATSYGVLITAGGSVLNSGFISALYNGVRFGGAGVYGAARSGTGTVFNTGSIIDAGTSGAGLGLDFGGVVTNSATGVIAGASDGVLFGAGGSTLHDAGRISAASGDAVHFTGSNNRLIVDPGAVFSGTRAAYGGGGSNDVLELAAGTTGTISGLGLNFAGFSTITVDAGANWVLSGSNIVTAGATLIDFGALTNTGTLLAGSAQVIVDPATFVNSGYVNSTVTLAGGSTLDNTATGTITAAGTAVLGINSPNTVVNAGTIEGSGTTGIGVRLFAGGTVGNGGTIDGGVNGIVIQGGIGTVSNSGSIAATDTNTGAGVALENGGSVSNAGGATISGFNNGVFIQGSTGTVSNLGTITSQNGPAVDLLGGGSVTNGVGGLVVQTSTGSSGIGIFLGAGGTVSNSGTVAAATAGNGVAVQFGTAGGTLINRSGGLVTAYHDGVGFFPGTAASPGTLSVVNYGTIVSTQLSTATSTGFSGFAIQTGTNGNATIDNFGTIAAAQTLGGSPAIGGAAILLAGGLVTNEAGGLVKAVMGNAIVNSASAGNGAVNIDNSGTIENVGSAHSAIYLGHGGVITNHAGAVISSANWHAVSFDNTLASGVSFGSVVNSGTISSTGTSTGTAVRFGQGGILTNQASGLISSDLFGVTVNGSAGTVLNFGTIQSTATGTSGEAVFLGAGGSVVNYGLITGARPPVAVGTATGYAGVVTTATVGATVDNFGTISSGANGNDGINLLHGGLIFNGVNGLILGSHHGIFGGGHLANTGTLYSYGGALTTVVNYGTIANTTSAAASIRIVADGAVINHGLIDSPRTGISFQSAGGTVDNFATVRSTAATSYTAGAGIYLQSGGLITNESGGLVTAQRSAISLGGTTNAGAVVTNLGTLVGSRGVSINAADSGSNTIDNFGVITGTGGTAISLGGGADRVVVEGGSTLSGAIANFTSVDTLDLASVPFSTSDTLAFDGTNLTVSGGGVSETVGLAALPAATPFFLGNDGSGGTDVTLAPASGAVVSAGEVLTVGSGQTLSNVTILSGGTLDVESGGTVVSTTIDNGGVETVLSGGVDSGATISSGGFEDVFGSAGGTVILNGGSQTVEAGGVVTGAVLDGIGLQLVFGFAGGTVVSSGDEQLVESGGVASGTTVSSGGLEVVLSGGVDSSATISSGGFENVFGSAGGTLILNGGGQTVEAGGSASGATISSGGLEVVLSGGVTSDTTIAGGTLELAAGAAAQGATTFSGSGGTLRIDGATTPTNTISSFAPGDTIDLAAIAFDSAGSATLLAGNVLQVSESGKTFTLNLDPGENFTGDDFMLGADAGSGTQVTASKTATVPGAGSRLAFFTPAVSDASLINVVLTSDGTDIAGKAIVGDYNIEVFTSTPGALASGFQASAFVQGAQLLTNNAIQAASPTSTEQLLDVSDPTQSYSLIDLSSSAKQGETIQIIGSTGAIYSVFGSAADTITGSANASVSQLIDASGVNKEANPGPFLGPETVTGGAGSTTVWGGKGDVITGGAGFMQVTDSSATGGQTVTGGAGALSIFDIGKNFSVTGSTAGTNFFDDTYSVSGAAVGGGSSVVGGSGTTLLAGGENTVIVAASGDAVTVGSALTYVDAQKGSTTITGGSGSGTGTVEGASGYNTNILAGSGDVITLNAAAAYIDATAGSTTITGGAGKVHVEAGAGDSITGGSGLLEVNNIGNADTIKGGTGNLFSFGKGTGETITGATSGWTLIDSSGKSSITGGSGTTAGTVTGAGGIFDNTVINGAAGDTITGGAASTTYINANLGSQTVTGGSGAATVLAGKGDSVTGGAGTLEVDLNSDQATTTVDLSKGTGAATLRDVSVSSGTAAVSVTGFSTAADTIASQTSVDTSGTFIASSKSDGAGGTILLFRDGTQMTLAGVSDITKVRFTPSVIPISFG